MLASATQQCESATGIHISLPSWTSLPTPHLIPPPSVVAEYHVEFPMWCSNFPLVIYFTNGNMFQYHCQFAPPSLSPEGSKVCFLCLSLHCCFANRYSSVFLSGVHIYVLIYDISFSFSDLLHSYNRFCRTGSSTSVQLISSTSLLWSIFHYIYIPQFLYLFICW